MLSAGALLPPIAALAAGRWLSWRVYTGIIAVSVLVYARYA